MIQLNAVNNIEHIINTFNENKLSHAFLIETNNIEKCLNDIKRVIKVINCENKYEDSCEKCNLCYQIQNETLPSFMIIRPDGATIKKDQVLELKEKMFTKPIYSKYNTYIILNSEKLNTSSANTLLKFIEEPEDNIVGFFITTNKENTLDTIKSRCQTIHEYYEEIHENLDEEKQELIYDYLKNIELDNRHALLYNKNIFLTRNYTREDVVKIFLEIFKIYESIYKGNAMGRYDFIDNKDQIKLSKKLLIINKTIDNLNKNGNINLILDSFVIEMR